MVNIMLSVTRNTHDGICLWACLRATIGESEGQSTGQRQPCEAFRWDFLFKLMHHDSNMLNLLKL